MNSPAGNYDNIIHLSRPITTHTPLSIEQRAAQFAPFKTITRYHDSTDDIEASSDFPEPEIIPDEDYTDLSPDPQVSPEEA